MKDLFKRAVPPTLCLLAVALSGCATTTAQSPSPPQPPLTVATRASLPSDPVLRVVTRGNTASAVGRSALSGALGALGGQPVKTFRKEDLRGTAIDGRPNPAGGALRDALQVDLRAYAQAHPTLVPPDRFELHYGTWLLVYGELSNGSAPYELRFDASLRAEPAALETERFAPVVQTCVPTPEVYPIEAWERDDYALVEAVAHRYVAQCNAEFAATLPRVFMGPRALAEDVADTADVSEDAPVL